MQYATLDVDVLDPRILDLPEVAKEQSFLDDQPARAKAIAIDPLLPQGADEQRNERDRTPDSGIVPGAEDQERG